MVISRLDCIPQGLVADAGGDVRAELEAKYRAELNRKLGDVNRFLESQSHLQGKLDTSRTEVEVNLMADKRRLEVGDLPRY